MAFKIPCAHIVILMTFGHLECIQNNPWSHFQGVAHVPD